MSLNIDAIKELIKDAYILTAERAFGEKGKNNITNLLDSIREFYQKMPPENIRGSFIFFIGIDSDPQTPIISSLGNHKKACNFSMLLNHMQSKGNFSHLVLEKLPDDTYCFLHNLTPVDCGKIKEKTIIYHFEDGVEKIIVNGVEHYIKKLSPVLVSNFSAPTLSDLEEAIEQYYQKSVRYSSCKLLSNIWIDGVEGQRAILVNKPEHIMRDSLVNALRLMLSRDAEVHPEHNTDETKPVDIRVTWTHSHASALIEIKWLGKSISNRERDTYTEYSDARANEGATQLADYLEREKRFSATTRQTKGYLVVFDARRRNNKGILHKVSKIDATFYRDVDIRFTSNLHIERSDFGKPFRLFMEPKLI